MSELLVRLLCMSLVVTTFNLFPVSFIVKYLTASNILSNFSIFLLVNIVLEFSICELDTCLKLSEVMLSASVIDPYSYSLTTFNIASRIFNLDNGNLLLSLKVVMVLLRSVQ